MTTLDSTHTTAVDHAYHWQPMTSCPKGSKVQLLTRYGCSSTRTGDDKPRGGTGPEQIVPDGFAAIRKLIWDPVAEKEDRAIAITPLGVVVQSDWLPIPCGHTTRATDAACEGCANQHRPPA